jgi:hypothetical protein
VSDVLKNQPAISDLNQLVREAYRLTMNSEKGDKPKKGKVRQEADSDDLRLIIKAGKEAGNSAYETLKQVGMIRNDFNIGG